MGAVACHDDRYKQINDLYGNEFKEHIVYEKGRAFLSREVAKTKKAMQAAAKKQESQLLRDTDEAEDKLRQYYLEAVKLLNERQPGGVSSLQQLTGASVESLLGYNVLKEYFQKLKKEISKSISSEQNLLLSDLTQITLEYQQQYLQNDTPNSQVFASLPKDQRAQIIKRGQMQFQSQISTIQTYILNKYDQQLDIEQNIVRFTSIDCRLQLQKLLNFCKDKIQTNLNLILSETIASYIIIK